MTSFSSKFKPQRPKYAIWHILMTSGSDILIGNEFKGSLGMFQEVKIGQDTGLAIGIRTPTTPGVGEAGVKASA